MKYFNKNLRIRLLFSGYNNTTYMCLFICLLLSISTKAQKSNTLSVQLKHIVTDNNVILRWAPLNYDTWKLGNQYGYTLKRYTTKIGTTTVSTATQYKNEVILATALKPLNEDQFSEMAGNNPMAGIAGAALYSDEFAPTISGTSNETGIAKAQNLVKEKENRFGYSLYAADQSPEVAAAMGLMFVEKRNIDEEYTYTIEIAIDPTTNATPITQGIVFVKPQEVTQFPAIGDLKAIPEVNSATLSWEKDQVEEHYSSYIIERAEQIVGPFEPITTTNFVPMDENEQNNTIYYKTELTDNTKMYYFRVIGRSPFGILSKPSNVVEVQSIPPRIEDANPFVKFIKEEEKGKIKIIWEVDEEAALKIVGYKVTRSLTIDGTYVALNQQLITSSLPEAFFEDNTLTSAAYYIIVAVDNNGYEYPSMPVLGQLHDETPPSVPNNVTCSATKDGKVTISWDKNTEEDLKGYRVFFSNEEDNGFTQITSVPVIENTFSYDLELEVLNKYIYYKVFALDYHENNSDLSRVCAMKRPDIIPPSAPVLFQALPTYDGVMLKWYRSSSKDVSKHQLQRKKTVEAKWTTLSENDISDFADISANKDFFYEYRVLAWDYDNNVSSSDILTIQPVYDGVTKAIGKAELKAPFKPSLTNIEVEKYFKPNKITLKWRYTQGASAETFVIYRMDAKTGSKYKIATISTDPNTSYYTYDDTNLKVGNTYIYTIELCIQASGCQQYGEQQAVTFRPKGGNLFSTGGYSTKMHTNLFDHWIVPYRSSKVIFDGAAIDDSSFIIVKRKTGLYGSSDPLLTLDEGKAKWQWEDTKLVKGGEYVYDYMVCDKRTGICRLAPMQTYIDFYKYPDHNVSVIHNYLPNYVQIQWENDGVPPGAYYLVTRSDTPSGVASKQWIVGAKNVLNGDMRLPSEDTDVLWDKTYYYSIFLVFKDGQRGSIAKDIKVEY